MLQILCAGFFGLFLMILAQFAFEMCVAGWNRNKN